MAREHDRYREERERRQSRHDARERDERDLGDRIADEVRSWFGDEDAGRRRRRDLDERGAYGSYGGAPRQGKAHAYERFEGSRYPGHFRGTDPERDWDRPEDAEMPYGPPPGPGVHSWFGGPWGGRYGFGGPIIRGGRYDTWGEHPDWFRGRHYGRGPKEYQRSPERIREDVLEALTWHGEVDATHITVGVEGDEVTLEGTVESRYEKRAAEDAAESVRGVHDVHNRLRVNRPEESE